MLPISLEMWDFLSHEHSVLDFTRLEPVSLIVGVINGVNSKSNGAGKSAIVDALTFALYNRSRVDENKNTSVSNLVREGTNRTIVEYKFYIEKVIYRIQRSWDQTKSAGKQSAVSFCRQTGKKWQPVASGKSNINKSIVDTIGIDYHTYINSVLFKQHEVSSIVSMTSGERKDVVGKILQLDQYTIYEKEARSRCSTVQRDIALVEMFINEHDNIDFKCIGYQEELDAIQVKLVSLDSQSQIVNTTLQQIREQQAELNRLNMKREELQHQLTQVSDAVVQYLDESRKSEQLLEEKQQQVTILEQDYKEAKDAFKDTEQGLKDRGHLKLDIQKIKLEEPQIETTHTDTNIAYMGAKKDVQDAIQKLSDIDNVDEGECPTCYSTVTAESKGQRAAIVQKQVETFQLVEADKKRAFIIAKAMKDTFKIRYDKLKKEVDKYNEILLKKKTLLEKIQTLVTRKQHLDESLEHIKHLVEQYVSMATQKQTEKEDIHFKLQAIEDVDQDQLQSLSQQVSSSNQTLLQLKDEISLANQRIGELTAQIKDTNAVMVKLKQERQKLKTLKMHERIFKELILAFSKNGIQALIFDNSVIEIEKITNDFLGRLTDKRMSIRIETQRESQKGSKIEVFEPVIQSTYHSNPMNLQSGGEAFRVAFAIRIALSQLLLRRTGHNNCGILIYDEAFQDLDSFGIDKLVESFAVLSKIFPYQLIITHQTELKKYFSSIITVQNNDGKAMVKQS